MEKMEKKIPLKNKGLQMTALEIKLGKVEKLAVTGGENNKAKTWVADARQVKR